MTTDILTIVTIIIWLTIRQGIEEKQNHNYLLKETIILVYGDCQNNASTESKFVYRRM